jgi:hypothetical protein
MITAILHEHGMNENLHGFVGEDNGEGQDDDDYRDHLHRAMCSAQDDGHDDAAKSIHKLLDPARRNGSASDDDEADDEDARTEQSARESREDRLQEWATSLREGRRPVNTAKLKRFVQSLRGGQHR